MLFASLYNAKGRYNISRLCKTPKKPKIKSKKINSKKLICWQNKKRVIMKKTVGFPTVFNLFIYLTPC